MRRLLTLAAATAAMLLTATPALACGGLIGPNGAVNLLRTTTFAGYHDGVEHYVTAFEFAGGGASSAASSRCRACRPTWSAAATGRCSGWCARRHPPAARFLALSPQARAEDRAQVLLETKIDALDITVLEGGGDEVGVWATDHGFRLPPDAPEVLDFYANRSPDLHGRRASTPTPPRARPGGRRRHARPSHHPHRQPVGPAAHPGPRPDRGRDVHADVFLLTDERPPCCPIRRRSSGRRACRSTTATPASSQLLADLRSDKGMEWVPHGAWLTKIGINAAASDLRFDLAIDASGMGAPSLQDAGFAPFGPAPVPPNSSMVWVILLGLALSLPLAAAWLITVVARSGPGGRPLAGA